MAALTVAGAGAPSYASARECSDLPTALRVDPLASNQGFQVQKVEKLYRMQARPWARIPTGARLQVRAPAGVTEADLHRALRCASGDNSPLAVHDAALRVQRAGDLYEVHVTSQSRASALEIQRRADAL